MGKFYEIVDFIFLFFLIVIVYFMDILFNEEEILKGR